MLKLSQYTNFEKKAFLATCLFLLVFWTLVMVTDSFAFLTSSIESFLKPPEKTSRETYCMKPENKKRKNCVEMQVKKKEQWEDVTRSSQGKKSTAFSLGK